MSEKGRVAADIMKSKDTSDQPEFNAAELGALAHLYRGELYRSKVWRQRLDATTNWAVAITGIAMSIVFSAANNAPAPIILAGLIAFVFLNIEARRYRYFDIWRTRTRLLEVYFYCPMLNRQPVFGKTNWNRVLAEDLSYIHFHISMWEALGRRLRRNYGWIFGVLGISYIGKLLVHPTSLHTLDQFWERAALGPVSGQVVIAAGVLGHSALAILALVTLLRQRAAGRAHVDTGTPNAEDPIMRMSI
jgi:uncharacterized membrane protein